VQEKYNLVEFPKIAAPSVVRPVPDAFTILNLTLAAPESTTGCRAIVLTAKAA
jgi:hypothetical protein